MTINDFKKSLKKSDPEKIFLPVISLFNTIHIRQKIFSLLIILYFNICKIFVKYLFRILL